MTSTKKRLDTLTHLSWESAEDENYHTVTRMHVKELVDAGFPLHGKYDAVASYLGKECEFKLQSLKTSPLFCTSSCFDRSRSTTDRFPCTRGRSTSKQCLVATFHTCPRRCCSSRSSSVP